MAKIEEYTVRGKTTRITEYDILTDIMAAIEENDYFHDGSIECITHEKECTIIGFKHYDDGEYKIRRLLFTGNVDLSLNLDLLVRYIYEIKFDLRTQIEVEFGGTGIIVKADAVKFQIQELLG